VSYANQTLEQDPTIDIDNNVDINDGPRDDQTEIKNIFEVLDHITDNIISYLNDSPITLHNDTTKLTNLATIALESAILEKIEYDNTIEGFISRNTRRMMLFK
jgi:hypothetical protein